MLGGNSRSDDRAADRSLDVSARVEPKHKGTLNHQVRRDSLPGLRSPQAWLTSQINLVSLVFGGTCGQMMTREEIGWILGISASRVRQIEQKAIVKIRMKFRAMGIDLDDLEPPANRESSHLIKAVERAKGRK